MAAVREKGGGIVQRAARWFGEADDGDQALAVARKPLEGVEVFLNEGGF